MYEEVLTLEKDNLSRIIRLLREMKLPVMSEQLIIIMESDQRLSLSTDEILERIITEEYYSRKNNKIKRLKKVASFSQPTALLNDLDYNPQRKLNSTVISQLQTNEYIQSHRNVMILGACGTGKSYIANALGIHACEAQHSVMYTRTYEMLDEMIIARRTNGDPTGGSERYTKCDVLILDDFLLNDLNTSEVSDIFRVLEERHGRKSTIICSQFEPTEWHRKLGGSVMADSILDRLTARSYMLVLEGESLRK